MARQLLTGLPVVEYVTARLVRFVRFIRFVDDKSVSLGPSQKTVDHLLRIGWVA